MQKRSIAEFGSTFSPQGKYLAPAAQSNSYHHHVTRGRWMCVCISPKVYATHTLFLSIMGGMERGLIEEPCAATHFLVESFSPVKSIKRCGGKLAQTVCHHRLVIKWQIDRRSNTYILI